MMQDETQDFTDTVYATPTAILYGAINRYLILRVGGRGAAEALQGLLSVIHPIRDDKFLADMESIRANSCSEWAVFDSIAELLKRKNLWLQPPRALVPGEELLGAID